MTRAGTPLVLSANHTLGPAAALRLALPCVVALEVWAQHHRAALVARRPGSSLRHAPLRTTADRPGATP